MSMTSEEYNIPTKEDPLDLQVHKWALYNCDKAVQHMEEKFHDYVDGKLDEAGKRSLLWDAQFGGFDGDFMHTAEELRKKHDIDILNSGYNESINRIIGNLEFICRHYRELKEELS